MCLQTEEALFTEADHEYSAFYNNTGEKYEKTYDSGSENDEDQCQIFHLNHNYATHIDNFSKVFVMEWILRISRRRRYSPSVFNAINDSTHQC
jgi:hypothetical protein